MRATNLIVMDPGTFAIADSLLTKLVEARKTIKAKFAKVIDPLKQALDEARSFFSEVDAPLAEAEGVIRGRMKGYKIEEARLARLEDEKRLAAADELRRQAEEKAIAESRAKTQAMKDRLAKERAELETKADVAQAAPAHTLVRAVGSTTRTVKVPQITDPRSVLLGILAKKIPLDIIEFDLTAIKAYYKRDPAGVAEWPGINWIEDIQIVHQGGRKS